MERVFGRMDMERIGEMGTSYTCIYAQFDTIRYKRLSIIVLDPRGPPTRGS